MSSEPDNDPEGTGRSNEMSPEELDRALRWLEELGGKSDAPTAQPLDDSPFHGLFDLQEGDVPAWLRETPSTESGELAGDTESRLDWLAKMASRESIEELPTLEWRRLSDAEQASIIAARAIEEGRTEAFTRESEEKAPVDETALGEAAADAADEALSPATLVDETVEEASVAGRITDDPALAATAVVTGLLIVEPTDEPLAPAVDVAEESLVEPVMTGVVLAATLPSAEPHAAAETSVDMPTPQLDDMDAAMAWLEELAANQETPIEDLPSVADRALASKLMAEASQMSPAREGVPVESPEGSPVRAADVAALAGAALAGATVYQSAASGGAETEDSPSPSSEPDPVEAESPTRDLEGAAAAAVVAASVAAVLPDEVDNEPVGDIAPTVMAIEPEDVVAETIPLEDREPATEAFMQVVTATTTAAVVPAVFNLGDALVVLDELAVPGGRGALNSIARVLEAEGPAALATPYSLEATLDWLLPAPGPVLAQPLAAGVEAPLRAGAASYAALGLESSLVDDMPEDPDAALAWMSQFVEDEFEAAPAAAVESPSTAGRVELSESVLLDMPEDPDEAIAWLEKLASQDDATA